MAENPPKVPAAKSVNFTSQRTDAKTLLKTQRWSSSSRNVSTEFWNRWNAERSSSSHFTLQQLNGDVQNILRILRNEKRSQFVTYKYEINYLLWIVQILTKSTKVMMNVRIVMISNTNQVRISPCARVSSPTHRQTTQIFLISAGIMDWRRIGMSGLRKFSPGNIIRVP